MADKLKPGDSDTFRIVEEVGDPDVTGMLVFLSFVITTTITVCTIMYTYFMRALPSEAYNFLDEAGLGWRPDNKTRQAAMANLVLSMSDQHLITGTAMVIACYAIAFGASNLNEHRSIFALNVATALAMCSTIVHINSLAVLSYHFKQHRTSGLIRLALILPLLALTFGARTFLGYLPFPEEVFDSGKDCMLSVQSLVYWQRKSPGTIYVFAFSEHVPTLVALWIPLYRHVEEAYGLGGLRALIRLCVFRRQLGPKEMLRVQQLRRQEVINELALAAQTSPNSFKSYILRARIVTELCYSSSGAQVLWLVVCYFWAMTEVIIDFAFTCSSGRENASLVEPSFGQLVPAVLLTVPVLSIVSTWLEIRKMQRTRESNAGNKQEWTLSSMLDSKEMSIVQTSIEGRRSSCDATSSSTLFMAHKVGTRSLPPLADFLEAKNALNFESVLGYELLSTRMRSRFTAGICFLNCAPPLVAVGWYVFRTDSPIWAPPIFPAIYIVFSALGALVMSSKDRRLLQGDDERNEIRMKVKTVGLSQDCHVTTDVGANERATGTIHGMSRIRLP